MSALVHYGFNLHQKVSYFCRFFLQIPKKTVEHKHKDLLNSKHFGMYVYYHILYFMKYNCTLLVHVRITIMWAFFLDWYPNINLLFRKSIKPRFLHQKNGWITKKAMSIKFRLNFLLQSQMIKRFDWKPLEHLLKIKNHALARILIRILFKISVLYIF